MEAILRPILSLISLITLTLTLTLTLCSTWQSTAWSSPADPDRPIPSALEKIPYSEISTSSSSVARGFSERNLFKMKAWRAWGSEVHDRIGAWIEFKWDKPRYLDTIHYVPGDERAPGYHRKMCASPAKLDIKSEYETRSVDLDDVRGHQWIKFDPPLVAKNLKFTVRKVRGASKQGGVCLAAISFYSHRDPLASIPKLKEKAEDALKLLKKPLMRKVAINRLAKLGPVISQLILKYIKNSSGEEQGLYLESASQLLQKEELSDLKALNKFLTPENRALYIRVRASIGDETAAQELLKRVDELSPSEQAEILLSVARSRDAKHLNFLLSKYGKHPEVDEALKPYIPDLQGAYEQVLKLYQSNNGQTRAAFLELLGKLDASKTEKLLTRAITQREDPMLQSGGIRGAAFTNNEDLRRRVRKLSTSVYVVVRRAVAIALAEWTDRDDASILRELAADKAMSVRTEALKALGHLGTEGNFLKGYALYGSDEATAEAAAQAWMSGKARLTVKAPLQLLASPYEGVRKSSIHAVTDHQTEACPLLIDELIRVDKIYPEHLTTLDKLWSDCASTFMKVALDLPKDNNDIAMLRVLFLVKSLHKPKMLALISAYATSDDPEVQVAVAKNARLLKAEEAEKLISPYINASVITPRCAAVKTLAFFQSKTSIKVIEKGIKSGLKDPYSADRAWLLCTIDAAGKYRQGEFVDLLAQAYQSWSKSLGFVSYRLKTIKAVSKLASSPQRLEILMKASTDLDRKIREIALKALKEP